ncbi:MAG: hypothetical protein GXO27_06415 [Chlorobi bacterium]|nr:hypothetical protein [Chlorobiota bacterium]
MKHLPSSFHRPALILFFTALAAGIWYLIAQPEDEIWEITVPAVFADNPFTFTRGWFIRIHNSILDEIISGVLILSGLAVMFSRVPEEDEMIERLRLESFQWAVLTSYILLFIAVWTMYGLGFLWVLIINIFVVMVLFIIRFERTRSKLRKETVDEK